MKIRIDADWYIIPEHCHDSLRRYLEDRIPPGSFLEAVLSNDLRGACECADEINRRALFNYVGFLYRYAPAGSWGSRERYLSWLNDRPETGEGD